MCIYLNFLPAPTTKQHFPLPCQASGSLPIKVESYSRLTAAEMSRSMRSRCIKSFQTCFRSRDRASRLGWDHRQGSRRTRAKLLQPLPHSNPPLCLVEKNLHALKREGRIHFADKILHPENRPHAARTNAAQNRQNMEVSQHLRS